MADIDKGYDAANLEAMSVAGRYRAAMSDLVVRKLRLSEQKGRLIDFGAGRGDYACSIQAMTPMSVVSLEPDSMLHPHYPSGLEVVSSLDAVERSSLDAAYSLNVLEHIEDDVAALKALAARCKPGAAIFILVPGGPSLWTPMDDLVGHLRRYTLKSLSNTVTSAGLRLEDAGWFDRTGYLATKTYQCLAAMRKESATGAVSPGQVKLFDAAFGLLEPGLAFLMPGVGKNCWVLAKKPS